MEINSVNANQTAPATVQLPSQEAQAESRELIKAVKALNTTEFFGQNNELTIVLNRETRQPIVRIVDRDTKEVVRQIPAKYALQMAEELSLEEIGVNIAFD